MAKVIVEHLGDGAYVTFTGYSYILTANHHDPNQASDQVHLDDNAVKNLDLFRERVNRMKNCEHLFNSRECIKCGMPK